MDKILLPTFVGWILGLLSGPVYTHIMQKLEFVNYKKGLKIELSSLSYRLLLGTFLIKEHFGKLDKEYLNWFLKHIKIYENPTEKRDQFVELAEMANKLSDSDLLIYNQELLKKSKNKSKSIPQNYTPILHNSHKYLTNFEKNEQNLVSNILACLHLINFKAKELHSLDKLTYSKDCENNYTAIVDSSDSTLKMILSKTEESVNLISELIEKL